MSRRSSFTVLFSGGRPVLRRADEHLDEVVVQRVIELPLKAPLELRIVEIPRMQVEVIGVDRNALVLELDDDFDALAFVARIEVEQRMLVQPKLG